MPFKEFLCTLESSISDLHAALVEVNIAQLSDDLLELNLVELDKEVEVRMLYFYENAFNKWTNDLKVGSMYLIMFELNSEMTLTWVQEVIFFTRLRERSAASVRHEAPRRKNNLAPRWRGFAVDLSLNLATLWN